MTRKGWSFTIFFVLFQSAESTETEPFTVMFAMSAWTKDWKENINADQSTRAINRRGKNEDL